MDRHSTQRLAISSHDEVAHRRGMVLLIVLVIVVMLTLAVYSFSEWMLAEAEATVMYGRDAQARAFAASGVELAAAMLGNRAELADQNFYHNPELFGGVLMRPAELDRLRGRFSVVAAVETDPQSQMVRYGLMDESAKLNLNALHNLGLDEQQQRDVLLSLPEMTHEIADAILDWTDEDDLPREFGAETEYYGTLAPPYEAKNGPMESLEELLLVRGVTPWLLFGEDANRNGLLDPSENDGDNRPPYDNADGMLQPGWAAYLTVHSRESNLRADGTPRINVNQNLLTELFDQLEQEFGEEAARFITAYRINGPQQPRTTSDDVNATDEERRQAREITESFAKSLFGSRGGGTISRGGLDLSGGGAVRINSLYELVDAEVAVEENGTRSILKSPWTSDSGDMQTYLPELMDKLSTSSNEFIPGRININQARREVLLGLPNMTEELADAIVGSQMIGSAGEPLSDTIATRQTTGWLVTEGVVDLAEMQSLDRYLTARGDVYRLQVIGYFDTGGPAARVEALIDATSFPPRVVFHRELTELGRGYLP